MADADAGLGRGLLEYLRARLGEPALQFSDPPTRVSGGFDTQIFAFSLRDALPPYAGPLILRVLAAETAGPRALREAVTQNTVAQLGYPAPRALLASADAALNPLDASSFGERWRHVSPRSPASPRRCRTSNHEKMTVL